MLKQPDHLIIYQKQSIMKKFRLLFLALTLCCITKSMAATHPVLPYSIDFTQVNFYGLPDRLNPDWNFTQWSKLYPADYSKGFWADYTGEVAFYGADGKTVSGLAALAKHAGPADAWLVTPGLYLEEGKSYEMTYTYKRFPGKIKGTQDPLLMTEKFEISIGKEKNSGSSATADS